MRRTLAALALAVASFGGALTASSPAGAQHSDLGWREAYDGVVHCTQLGNQVVCDKYGPPANAYYLQGVIELWYPGWCPPADMIGGWQGAAPFRLRLGGSGWAGCGLGVYPSTTQAFAAWSGNPAAKVDYAGELRLRPGGILGNGSIYLTAEGYCNGCAANSRMLDVVAY